MELKIQENDLIQLGKNKYSKNDLLACFDYFDDEKNWEMILLNEKYPFLNHLEKLSKISDKIEFTSAFYEDEQLFSIQLHLTNLYKDDFQKEIRKLVKKEDFPQLRFLISYFEVLTNDVKYEFSEYIKSQIELKLTTLENENFKLKSQSEMHFTFSTSFIEIVHIVGEDDISFITDALSVAIKLYNNNDLSRFFFIRCMKAHLLLPHFPENLNVIKGNILQQEKEEKGTSGKDGSTFKTIWLVIVALIMVLRVVRSCDPARTYHQPKQPELNEYNTYWKNQIKNQNQALEPNADLRDSIN